MENKDKSTPNQEKIEITDFVRSMVPEKSLPPDDGSVTDYFEYMLRKHK